MTTVTTVTEATKNLRSAYQERNERIRQMYTSTYPRYDVEDIADAFGLSVKRVYDICAGLKRPHKPVGCEECKANPYGNTGLCRACYERNRLANKP